MTDTADLERKFWDALDDDRTVMLGAEGVPPRPMTAIAEDQQAPIWFFTARDTELARAVESRSGLAATASFAAKDHEVFARLSGALVLDNDPSVIDRLWNPFIGAWFEGKDDPKLRLLRMDAGEAHVWLNEHSLLAGVKLLLGTDPKKAYKDKVGDVDLKD